MRLLGVLMLMFLSSFFVGPRAVVRAYGASPSASPSCPLSVTRRWLDSFVLPLKLCPFAYRPLVQRPREHEMLHFSAGGREELVSLVGQAATRMCAANAARERLTSMIVLSSPSLGDMLLDFPSFMDFVNADLTSSVREINQGSVQVASFHPGFQFNDSSPSDNSNFVNRSPYPMIHLLSEEEVTAAVEGYSEKRLTAHIWQNNYEVRIVPTSGEGGFTGHKYP